MKTDLRAVRFQNGMMYLPAWNQAVEVHGAILAKYMEYGGATGFLGRPYNDETATPDGVGRFNHFEGGSIYWSPATGAHVVSGAIRDKWAAGGWEQHPQLGYPISDVYTLPGEGLGCQFQRGNVYWHPATGAHALSGRYLEKFNYHGGVSTFGYPTTDLFYQGIAGGRHYYRISFQRGSIAWDVNFIDVEIIMRDPYNGVWRVIET